MSTQECKSFQNQAWNHQEQVFRTTQKIQTTMNLINYGITRIISSSVWLTAQVKKPRLLVKKHAKGNNKTRVFNCRSASKHKVSKRRQITHNHLPLAELHFKAKVLIEVHKDKSGCAGRVTYLWLHMEGASSKLSQVISLNQSKIKGNSDAFHSELIYSRDREVTRT